MRYCHIIQSLADIVNLTSFRVDRYNQSDAKFHNIPKFVRMKLKLLPLIFLAIYFANSSEFSSKIPQSACKIVSDVIEKENWMKTIAIMEFDDNFDEKLIDKIAKCLPSKITVVMIDATTNNSNLPTIHNVDYVITVIDEFNIKKRVNNFLFFFN